MGRDEIKETFERQREVEQSHPWMKILTTIIIMLALYGLWDILKKSYVILIELL